MNATTFAKIATITNLVGEIVGMDKDISCLNVELDFLISHLTNYKKTCAECVAVVPKKVVMKYQLDADGNRIGEGVPVPNTFPPAPEPQESESEEDEVSVVSCKCNDGMDIRGRCDPIKSAKQFAKCPARVDTTYFHILNDFEKYQDIQASKNRGEKHKKIFAYARAEPFFLKDIPYDDGESLLDELLLELIEQDEQNEDENLCMYCDEFVSFAEEDDEAVWNEDRLVCPSCVVGHFCLRCEEFMDEELTEFDKQLYCESCLDWTKNLPLWKAKRVSKQL